MKRALAAVLVVVIVLLVGRAQATAPKVTLTYWCSPFPNEAGWAIMVTRWWNLAHPDIHVRLQSIPQGSVAEEMIRQAIRSHQTPDVCSHLFPANVHEFARMGGLLSLDECTALRAAAEKRSGKVLSALVSPDGHLYQIPWKCNPIMLEYNATLLKKYGLKPPRTYGEFVAVAEVLRKRANMYAWAPDAADKFWNRYYDFYPLYMAASGGRSFLDANGNPAFDNAAGVAVMEFLGKSFRRGYAPTTHLYDGQNALNDAFASGKIAFLLTGPWNAALTQELVGTTLAFNFTPVPVPDGTDPRSPVYTYGNFRNLGIFSTCTHRDEAARFLEFLISRQADTAFLKMSSELPDRQGLLTDDAFTGLLHANPYLATFARQVAYVRPVENAEHFNQALSAVSRQYVESAVRGNKSAAQAVKDAASECANQK